MMSPVMETYQNYLFTNDALYNFDCSNTAQLNNFLTLNKNDITTNCSTSNMPVINKVSHFMLVCPLQDDIDKLKSTKSDGTKQLFPDRFNNNKNCKIL